MAKAISRKCPACKEVKTFRSDQKTCGCGAGKQTKELTEISDISENKWIITLPKTRIHTLDQLIEYFEIDLSIWEVERFVANKWEVGMKPPATTMMVETEDGRTVPMWTRDEDKPIIEPLFQVKAFLKKKQSIADAKQELEELKKLAQEVARTPIKIRKTDGLRGNMLEIDISDHHFGKLAWAAETGHQNYDTKIAAKLFKQAFQTILERTKAFKFDEIWFIVGNDLLNSDDIQGRTTKGTFVSTDVRYQKTFSVVRNVMIECIETLRTLTPKTKVIMVSGNHDHLSVWHLGDSLGAYFHKYDDVEIDNSPRYYKYHRFGDVLVMFTHGDKGSRKDYPLLMATEQSAMFGETKFREIHTGHVHRTQVDEQHGVRVRIMSALCPPDAWHAENGFVGNLRSSEAFIWNKNEGLIGTVVYTDIRETVEE